MSRARRDRLWEELELGTPYETAARPPYAEPDDTLALAQGLSRVGDKNEYLAQAMDHAGDTLPASRGALAAQLPDRRLAVVPRLIHRVGVCAKVRLNVDGEGLYTGILARGTEVHGICRASLPSSREFSPGFGFKWFVEAGPTESFLVSYGADGFDEDEGFLAHPMATELAGPASGFFSSLERKARAHASTGFFQAALAWWRARAEPTPPNPLRQDLASLCARDAFGRPVSPVVAPRALVMRASATARRDCDRAGGSDFRDHLEQVQPGPLLTVEDEAGTRLGSITLEAPFVASAGGDHQLFFQHPMERP